MAGGWRITGVSPSLYRSETDLYFYKQQGAYQVLNSSPTNCAWIMHGGVTLVSHIDSGRAYLKISKFRDAF